MSGGTILRADVALGVDGRSRGFGMVTYATESDAESARKMFNGYVLSCKRLACWLHSSDVSSSHGWVGTPGTSITVGH